MSDRKAGTEICESVGTDEKRALAIGEAERQSRLPAVLHLRFHGGVDGRHGGVTDHPAIVRLIPAQSDGV